MRSMRKMYQNKLNINVLSKLLKKVHISLFSGFLRPSEEITRKEITLTAPFSFWWTKCHTHLKMRTLVISMVPLLALSPSTLNLRLDKRSESKTLDLQAFMEQVRLAAICRPGSLVTCCTHCKGVAYIVFYFKISHLEL